MKLIAMRSHSAMSLFLTVSLFSAVSTLAEVSSSDSVRVKPQALNTEAVKTQQYLAPGVSYVEKVRINNPNLT